VIRIHQTVPMPAEDEILINVGDESVCLDQDLFDHYANGRICVTCFEILLGCFVNEGDRFFLVRNGRLRTLWDE
jgi:hypothetical protein